MSNPQAPGAVTPVALPLLFENMEEATLGRWLVQAGDDVASGAPLCELITEKTTLELPSPVAGRVLALVAREKSVLPTGSQLALVGPAQADFEAALLEAVHHNQHLREHAATPSIGAAVTTTPPQGDSGTRAQVASSARDNAGSGGGRVRATPAARRAAREAGVELEAVAATCSGVVSEEAVLRFVRERAEPGASDGAFKARVGDAA